MRHAAGNNFRIGDAALRPAQHSGESDTRFHISDIYIVIASRSLTIYIQVERASVRAWPLPARHRRSRATGPALYGTRAVCMCHARTSISMTFNEPLLRRRAGGSGGSGASAAAVRRGGGFGGASVGMEMLTGTAKVTLAARAVDCCAARACSLRLRK
ncbi:hypothetical protein T492DRAFT_503725 [Pavlovales sp. CCMP2436]|nr:hypothetical protein T492DRAFT_503725 [Pavlovales sp. CCMP2436]